MAIELAAPRDNGRRQQHHSARLSLLPLALVVHPAGYGPEARGLAVVRHDGLPVGRACRGRRRRAPGEIRHPWPSLGSRRRLVLRFTFSHQIGELLFILCPPGPGALGFNRKHRSVRCILRSFLGRIRFRLALLQGRVSCSLYQSSIQFLHSNRHRSSF